VEKAARSIPPSVLLPVGPTIGFPRRAIAEGDSGFYRAAVLMGSAPPRVLAVWPRGGMRSRLAANAEDKARLNEQDDIA
jgi:hypothetical protein